MAAPILVLALAGCAHTSDEQRQRDLEPEAADGPAGVSRDDLLAELRHFEPQRRAAALKDEKALQQLLEILHKREAVSQEAEALAYHEHPDVAYALERAREIALTRAAPERYIAEREMPSFKDEARAYYEERLESEFTPPEEVRVSHILLQAPSDEAKAAARPKMEEILAKIEAGEPFGEMAKKHSQDASRFMFGDLGMVRRGQMVPEFEEVAFALEEPGDISGIVETRFGLHLIQLTEKPSRDPIPFEEVEERIIAKLKRQYQQGLVDAWVESLAPSESYMLPEPELSKLLAELRAELGVPTETGSESQAVEDEAVASEEVGAAPQVQSEEAEAREPK